MGVAAGSGAGVCRAVAEMRELAAEVVATVYPWATGASLLVTTPPLEPGGDPQVTDWQVPCDAGRAGRRARDVWPALAAAVLRLYPDAVKASLCLTLPCGRQSAWLPVSCGPAGLSSPAPSRSASA